MMTMAILRKSIDQEVGLEDVGEDIEAAGEGEGEGIDLEIMATMSSSNRMMDIIADGLNGKDIKHGDQKENDWMLIDAGMIYMRVVWIFGDLICWFSYLSISD